MHFFGMSRNNPVSGYNNKDYSDIWADPHAQTKPAAWSSHTISQLQSDVSNYTSDVCNSLKAQGTTPDAVQLGKESNVGMQSGREAGAVVTS